jgi:hypothetical protein
MTQHQPEGPSRSHQGRVRNGSAFSFSQVSIGNYQLPDDLAIEDYQVFLRVFKLRNSSYSYSRTFPSCATFQAVIVNSIVERMRLAVGIVDTGRARG